MKMSGFTNWLGDFALPILLAVWLVLFAATVRLARWRGYSSLSDRRAGPVLFAVGFALVTLGVFAVVFAQPQTVADLSLLDTE